MIANNKTERQRALLDYLEKYLAEAYLSSSVDCGGHDVNHVYRMHAIAAKIIPDDADLFLLKIAIWFHNLDRSSHHKLGDAPHNPEPFIRKMLNGYLDVLTLSDVDMIVDAVLKHDKLNDSSDSPLLTALKDCDRLDVIGTGPIGVIKIAQYRHTFPLYRQGDFDAPQSSRKPSEVVTVIQQIHFCLEWELMLRLPKAKEYVKESVAFLRAFIEECNKTHNQLFREEN